MAAAYALALQVLLSGLAAGHFMAVADPAAGDLFVICHGRGNAPSDDQGLPDRSPLPRAPCVLCTLAQAPCAILPTHHGIAAVEPVAVSTVASASDRRVIAFVSPTGQYQRGPPARPATFG
jgi:hypothetical protein